MKCEGPTIGFRKCGEAGHRRALKALSYNLIETEEAALARAVIIGKIDRWRLERHAGCRRGTARSTVTRGAVLRKERRCARQIRRASGSQRNRVRLQQRSPQGTGQPGNALDRGFLLNRLAQLDRHREETGLGRSIGKRGYLFADGRRKFDHFAVFEIVDDLPVRHRCGVIDSNVVEKAPGRAHLCALRARYAGQA